MTDSVGAREDNPAFHWLALASGPALAVLIFTLLKVNDSALTQSGQTTTAIAAWMACWWLTEAVPLAATALLPLVAFPLLGVASIDETAAPYANSLIFLFMGGFILGLGMQRWGLHRRVALVVLKAAGNDTRRLVAGFMLVTALLSMWISNTATAIMLLPIASSLIATVAGGSGRNAVDDGPLTHLATALMLAIAYSASIGGVATLIGTPPNLILAAFLREHYGVELDMLRWLAIGLPFTAIMLPLAWLYLTRVACRKMASHLPGSQRLFAEQLRQLGPLSRGEWIVMLIFACAVTGWVLRPQLVAFTGLKAVSDAVIAMAAALALFAIPVCAKPLKFAMDWSTARKLPWEILILFGGGLTLAAAVTRHGVDAWIASALDPLAGAPLVLVALAVASLVVFLTEITSNTAVTATLLPVLAASAIALGVPPGPLLVAAALSASCAFMLPVATPPNAIVFASGHLTIAQMARAGFALNLLSIITVTLLVTAGAGAAIAR
jgi:sodium-dependent dicarboxylate transporter 2/3/5